MNQPNHKASSSGTPNQKTGLFRASPLSLACLSLGLLILFLAPFWASHFQIIYDRRTFLESESMVFLALTIALGLFSAVLLRRVRLAEGKSCRLTSLHEKLFLLTVILAAFFGYSALNKFILHSFMNSADEHSCYFLAECLRLGRFWVEPHPLSEFFNVVHVGNRAGKWFSVYPPGWPLLMAFGLKFKIVDFLNPALAALSLFFIYKAGKKVFSSTAAAFAVTFCLLSPFFAFTSASYYSHTTCLLAMAVFLYAFFMWQEQTTEKGRLAWGALAAAAVGYGLITRYLTMASFAAPFLLAGIWPVLRRKRALRASDCISMGIILAFFVVIFYQNYDVTGRFYKAPNKFDKSWERLGFSSEYDIIDGLVFIMARSFYLMDWSAPVLAAAYLAVLFMKGKWSLEQNLVRYSFLYPLSAYFFYFSWGGNQYGPRYYYEGFPFMLLAVGEGLRRSWVSGSPQVRRFLATAVMVSVVLSVYLFFKHSLYFEEVSRQRKALYVLAEATIKEPAVVHIKGFIGDKLVMAQEDAVRNGPLLDGKILYAHDLGERNIELMNAYPYRQHFRGTYDRIQKHAVLEKLGRE